MASLYQLQAEYLDLLELLEDPESDQKLVTAAMESIRENTGNKIEGYMKVYKNLTAQVEPIDDEIKRLQERKKACEKGAENIRKTVLDTMINVMGMNPDEEKAAKRTLKTDLFTLRVGRGQISAVVDDEEEISEECFDAQAPKLNKSRLKDYLKEHPECEGAHIERNPYLSII